MEQLILTLPNGVLDKHILAYRQAVVDIRELATVIGHTRPTHSRRTHPFVQKEMPDIRRDKFREGVTESKQDFARYACKRVSPFATADSDASDALDDDLKIALDIVVARGSKIAGDRKARMKELHVRPDICSPHSATRTRPPRHSMARHGTAQRRTEG